MKVIKKDGRIQELSGDKIKTSILSATNSARALLNESDINILVEDIIKTLESTRKEDGITSSYEIIGVVIEMLKRDGFSDVIDKYVSYE